MPIPIVAGVVVGMVHAIRTAVVSWLSSVGLRGVLGAAIGVGSNTAIIYAALRPEEFTEIRDELNAEVAERALALAGVELDKNDPFSDASMCGAIGKKTGVELRTMRDRDSIRKDVEHWALARLEEKTGLHIRNIHDKEKTKKDLLRFASPVVSNATGLPLTDISDAEKTKGEVEEYLQDRALIMLADDITKAKQVVQGALKSTGISLERLAERIEKAGGYTADGRPAIKVDLQLIALGIVSRALINADRRRREKEAELSQCGRRAEQLRGGLKRFREKHGSRMTYERI